MKRFTSGTGAPCAGNSPLRVELFRNSAGETVLRTLDPLTFHALGVKVKVPRGFSSDGASMPRFFWRLIGHPFQMDYLKEAVCHDWLYRTQKAARSFADLYFSALLRPKLSFWRRWSIYLALRLFGWIAWRINRKRRSHSR